MSPHRLPGSTARRKSRIWFAIPTIRWGRSVKPLRWDVYSAKPVPNNDLQFLSNLADRLRRVSAMRLAGYSVKSSRNTQRLCPRNTKARAMSPTDTYELSKSSSVPSLVRNNHTILETISTNVLIRREDVMCVSCGSPGHPWNQAAAPMYVPINRCENIISVQERATIRALSSEWESPFESRSIAVCDMAFKDN